MATADVYQYSISSSKANNGVVELTIESSLLAQEAHLSVRVASHRAHNDSFLLATLKPINRPELYARICFFKHSCQQCQL
jgi:hypothetical protein